ncbi:uncharacterized protein EV154DRAFT_476360 [Mucor mucedo]|uniref:uncharacterized protein n=1 Tax=Mucor mucedo TaxID=29922 RepID=UPI00221E8567|nr:uncharacterized protein EV154DRAFT_476360 [Mucor mucedo]KAI7896723.1 hypothetical protein EV154DRAFT_476360 [Mucor mucedo]
MDISGATASNNIKHTCMLFTAACYKHPPSKHGIIQIKVSQWTLEISLKLKQKRSTMKRHASVYTETNTFEHYILKTVGNQTNGISKQSSYNIKQLLLGIVKKLTKCMQTRRESSLINYKAIFNLSADV